MATIISDNHEFTIDEWGDNSATHFQGKFDLKTVLTHREQLQRDELRRLYIGANHQTTPGLRASNQSELLAEINTRIRGDKGCPSWWKDSSMGLDLKDDNVVLAINKALNEGLEKREADVKKAIAEARGDIKTLTSTP